MFSAAFCQCPFWWGRSRPRDVLSEQTRWLTDQHFVDGTYPSHLCHSERNGGGWVDNRVKLFYPGWGWDSWELLGMLSSNIMEVIASYSLKAFRVPAVSGCHRLPSIKSGHNNRVMLPTLLNFSSMMTPTMLMVTVMSMIQNKRQDKCVYWSYALDMTSAMEFLLVAT